MMKVKREEKRSKELLVHPDFQAQHLRVIGCFGRTNIDPVVQRNDISGIAFLVGYQGIKTDLAI